jgi:hypothetical protein
MIGDVAGILCLLGGVFAVIAAVGMSWKSSATARISADASWA